LRPVPGCDGAASGLDFDRDFDDGEYRVHVGAAISTEFEDRGEQHWKFRGSGRPPAIVTATQAMRRLVAALCATIAAILQLVGLLMPHETLVEANRAAPRRRA